MVVGVTVVIGAALLAGTLLSPADSDAFSIFGFGLAAVWIVGSLTSGPLPFVRQQVTIRRRRLVALAVLVGVGAYAVFVVAAVVSRQLPLIGPAVDDVLGTADARHLGLVLPLALTNAVAEEMFFRGALFSAIGGRFAPYGATIAYVLVTVATGNVALVVAAAAMGSLFMVERVLSRGILTSAITHVTWSALVILALPR